jgi:hypothetical protein
MIITRASKLVIGESIPFAKLLGPVGDTRASHARWAHPPG